MTAALCREDPWIQCRRHRRHEFSGRITTPDRPGPKSRGPYTSRLPTDDVPLWHAGSVGHDVWVDVRVGGSRGRSPPTAPIFSLNKIDVKAKSPDPTPEAFHLNRLGTLGPAFMHFLLYLSSFYLFRSSWHRQMQPGRRFSLDDAALLRFPATQALR